MTPTEQAAWRALAEKANEGGAEWQYAEDFPVVVLRMWGAPIVCRMVPDGEEPTEQDEANGRFIASCSPTKVLALLDYVQALEALEAGLRAALVEAQRILAALQWSRQSRDGNAWCPECGGPAWREGHTRECALRRVLNTPLTPPTPEETR